MSEEKDDYSYWSEALHSSYLFYTMEVDRLNKQLQACKEENERLEEANLTNISNLTENIQIMTDKLNKQIQQNKQMREALEKVKKDSCCSNGDCEHCEYDEDCFGYDAQQALKGVE